MTFWVIMNWVAYASSALIFGWLIKDFINIEKNYDEKILLAMEDWDKNMEDCDKKGG